jgi:hypothetical protein
MTDKHTRDYSWETDLIWHYFHEVTTPANTWANWYTEMDPLGELSNRHRVYELLVDEADHTYPGTQEKVGKSMIPWNQNNAGFLKRVGGALWCGSLVKIVLVRYMGWSSKEPTARDIKAKGFNAALWTINNLKRNVPVRASLGGHHYVGIVGHRCRGKPLPPGMQGPEVCSPDNDFLCIEPWAFGINATDSIKYAGKNTGFLGIIKQTGTVWTYGTELIGWVET